jgi:hypothetical protein
MGFGMQMDPPITARETFEFFHLALSESANHFGNFERLD